MTLIEIIEASGRAKPRRKAYVAVLGILYASVVLLSAAHVAGWPFDAWRGQLVDFHDFYLAGALVANEHVERAYRFIDLVAQQQTLFGSMALMPWTYPPQFDLLVAPLSRLPIAVAYAVFVGASLSAYVLTIRRLAPEQLASVFMLIAPAMVVTIRCGQNGFLTGALVGSTAIGLLQGRAWAGIPLGLMIIKPHLAVAFALHVLVTRRWKAAALAGLVVALTSLVATVALGVGVWAEFLGAVKEAGGFLSRGLYPQYRMISGYAMARSLGCSAGVGTLVQFAFAAVGVLATAFAVGRFSQRQAIGIAAIASVMISPYAYDYDLPLFGVGVAMLLGDLKRYGTKQERLGLYVFVLGVQTTAFVLAVWADFLPPGSPQPISVGCLAVTGTLIMAWRILERARGRAPAAVMAPNADRRVAETCAV